MPTKTETFEGQVVFYTTFQTLESLIVSDKIDAAVPEHDSYAEDSWEAIFFENFRIALANTVSIDFKLKKDTDWELRNLKDFWKLAEGSDDYAALWPKFRQMVTLGVHNVWRDAVGASVPARLLERDILRPGAPEDEELDPNAVTPETAP